MSVLSDRDIINNLGKSVIIDPFVPENVNTSSVDVTLGEFYFMEQRPRFSLRKTRLYNIWDMEHVNRVWGEPCKALPAGNIWNRFPRPKNIKIDDQVIMLPPRHTILAHTREFIGGKYNVTTMMKARSSMGRNFIEVCKCAGYGDVGYTNRWTMEITNNSRFYHIPLIVGRRIAQIVFLRTGPIREDDYTTGGKYQTLSDIESLKTAWNPYMMLPKLFLDRDVR